MPVKKSWGLKDSRSYLIHLNVEGDIRNFIDNSPTDGYSPIPRIVHQIWVGSPPPLYLKNFQKEWQETNPEWDFKTWDENSLVELPDYDKIASVIKTLIHNKVFDNKSEREHFVLAADLIRLHLLLHFGGIYLDADTSVGKRPLKTIDKSTRTSWACIQGKQIKTGAIGSVPQDDFLKFYYDVALQRIVEAIETKSSLHAVEIAGPRLMTALWKESAIHEMPRPDLLPQNWFYSYSWRDKMPEIAHEESIGVHHWASAK